MKNINLILAWLVHIFTASGLIVGLYSIISIVNGNYSLLLKLTVIGLIIDGIDGTMARKLKVKELIPEIDGTLLDNITDYINYTFIPVIFFYLGEFIEEKYKVAICIGILLSSAYQFSRTDAKTNDNYFRGFPSLWNLFVILNIIFKMEQITNLITMSICIITSFIPIKFIYPSKTKELRKITIPITIISCLIFVVSIFSELSTTALKMAKTVLILYFVYLTLASIYLTYKTRNR
ncbi:phosphatidylcholine synthase [Borreliella burgdorferi]|uniref:phosphatidylcholine synthase n=1 Tax=Borreliella burgdorferi TaxID=139 RepID=UPI000D045CDF|nr:phosphatidylcholine/phosphatidylserine synthase [Borreliella burgdorferi]MCD2412690.1 phosphatidylcholine/phosphatidylserine synthase [Borreliella burgdorferi]PRR16405.1 phosphatidyltransferase [Borreliella burgdorferi]PRR20047.1 phosphatidyltransferase [Borreliella burgdorferi]PRR23997.1 phosphatidyltransferase [Borreliella burgdorferi]PRR54924.1 phosphatidyltransferase [Borreliella burgdorferi]